MEPTVERTNYVEAVGLITIGFAIYDTIFGQFTATGLALEWGLSSDFDVKRMALVTIQCLLVASSLRFLQSYDYVADSHPPVEKGTKAVVSWAFSGSFSKNELKKLSSIFMQLFSVLFSYGLFGEKTATYLAIGFGFVDYAIFKEAKRQIEKGFQDG